MLSTKGRHSKITNCHGGKVRRGSQTTMNNKDNPTSKAPEIQQLLIVSIKLEEESQKYNNTHRSLDEERNHFLKHFHFSKSAADLPL